VEATLATPSPPETKVTIHTAPAIKAQEASVVKAAVTPTAPTPAVVLVAQEEAIRMDLATKAPEVLEVVAAVAMTMTAHRAVNMDLEEVQASVAATNPLA